MVMENISNTTSSEILQTTFIPAIKILGILTIPIVLVGFFGAVLLLYNVKKDSQQHRSVKAMFVNLCLSTLVFCIFCGPFQALTYITQGNNFLANPANDAFCQFNAFLNVTSIYVAALCHATIAANRFFVIVFYDRPRIQNSRLLLGILLISPWLITISITIFPLFHLGATYGYTETVKKCNFLKRDKSYLLASRTISAGLALVVMCCSYFFIWVKVTKRTRHQFVVFYRQSNNVSDTSAIPRPAPAISRRMRKEVRVARSTFVTCFVFVVCFLPATIQAYLVQKASETQSTLGLALILVQWIGIAISPWLPIVLNKNSNRPWRNAVTNTLISQPSLGV